MKPCLRFRGFEISAGFLQIENNLRIIQKKKNTPPYRASNRPSKKK